LEQQQKLKEEQQKKLELSKKNNLNNSMNNSMNNNMNNSMSNMNLNTSMNNKPLSYEQLVKELQNAKQDRDSYAKNLEDQLKKSEELEKQVADLKNKLNKYNIVKIKNHG